MKLSLRISILLAITLLARLNPHVHAEVLAVTQQDFSTAAQGTAGFEYGYYDGVQSTTAPFSTVGMHVYLTGWSGNDGDNTPACWAYGQHPGTSLRPAVRRYTVGAPGEPSYTGTVRIVGRFSDLDQGATSGFIAVDPDGDAGPAARTLLLTPTSIGADVPFDLTVDVAPGTTIDFGILADGNGNYDANAFTAAIVTGDTPVPTNVVASRYHSPDHRYTCFGLLTDAKATALEGDGFDTYPDGAGTVQFAGLLYQQPLGSTQATRFDTVRIDMGHDSVDGGDFTTTPRIYILKTNCDPNTASPLDDSRYHRLLTAPIADVNSAGRTVYTFNLTTFTADERTGYGFVIAGENSQSSHFISVDEIAATGAVVDRPSPFFTDASNGHRYGLTQPQTWLQAESEAVSLGGHLVVFDHASQVELDLEQNVVLGAFGAEPMYIGIRRNAGVLQWLDNDPVDFNRWASGNPGGPTEEFVVLNYWPQDYSYWHDVFPQDATSFRGIVELPSASTGRKQYQLMVSGKANVFAAGGNSGALADGVVPPSLRLTAGQKVTITDVFGSIFSGAETARADGAHNPPRACDITGVGGVSGYLNANNSAHLVGVFVGDQPLQQTPQRLDFSTAATGEDFYTLTPGLGQVFFIGDGFTTDGSPQEFIAPAGATQLCLGIPDAFIVNGGDPRVYTGPPNAYGDNTGAFTVRVLVESLPTPVILSQKFPDAGGSLQAAGGTPGPNNSYSWQIFSGNFPPHLLLNPDGSVVLSGQPRVNGTYTFTVRATDAADVGVSTDKVFTLVVADPIPVATGIVAWWPGDDAVADIVGGYHGSLKNYPDPVAQPDDQWPAFASGKIGRSFVFDGINQFVQVADADALDLTGDLTIEAWVNVSANSGERTIVSKRSADNNDITYTLFLRNGIPYFTSRVGGGNFRDVSPGVILQGGWNHLAVTIAGSTLKMFINGTALLETTTYDAIRPATTAPLTIGATITDSRPASNPDGAFAGCIDELALYNRALTDVEVTAIYTAGAGGKKRSDAARDFSLTQNPNDVWTYGYVPVGSTKTTDFVKFTHTDSGPGTIGYWDGPTQVTKNTGSNWVVVPSGGTQFDWAPNQLGLGTDPSGNRPTVRWTAPAPGRYAVSVNFYGCDTRPVSVDTHLFHNGVALFGGSLGTYPAEGYVGSYRGDGLAVTRTITAQAGDKVDFLSGASTNGFYYDSMGAFISVVYLGSALEIVETEFPTQPADGNTPWQLTATGGSGSYVFSRSGDFPPHLELAANGAISLKPNVEPTIGHYHFTVTVSDGQQTAQRSYDVAVAEEFALPANPLLWVAGELHPNDIISGVVASDSNVAYGRGKVGRALVLNGADQSLAIPSTALNRDAMTIEAWIKPELRTDGSAADFFPTNIVSGDRRNYGGNGIGVNVFPDGAHMWIEVQNYQAFHQVPNVSFTAGQWYHVALVLSSGNAKTYINGELKDDYNFSQEFQDGDPVIRIGRHNEDTGYGANRFFKGAIDEVSIYGRSLAAEEIAGIYNADALGKTRDDAARDFSTSTANGNPWKYGTIPAGPSPTGAFTPYTQFASESTIRAWRNASGVDPNVICNIAETPYLHWAPRRLSAHPGPGGEYSVVRWTATTSGIYAVACEFSRLNTQSGGSGIFLRHNSTLLTLDSNLITDAGAKQMVFHSISASSGDTVDFIVGVGDGYGFDATGLVPTVALLTPAAQITTQTFPISGTGRKLEPQGTGYTYKVISGVLPPGITLNSDGTILGAPSKNGSYTFTVQLTQNGLSSQRQFTVEINDVPPPPPISPTNDLKIYANGSRLRANAVTRQDNLFLFRATQPLDTLAPGLNMRIEYTATPDNPSTWQPAPSDDMDRDDKVATRWENETRRVPVGENLWFRTVTTARDRTEAAGPVVDSVLAPVGPITITPTPLLEVIFSCKSTAPSGTVSDAKGLTMRPDELILYSIKVKNIGSQPAKNLVFGLPIPAKTVYDGSPDSSNARFELLDARGKVLSGASDKLVKKVQFNFARTGAELGVNESAELRFWVELDSAYRSSQPFGESISARKAYVTYTGKVAEDPEKELKTQILAPVRLQLTSTPGPVYRGSYIGYTLTAINEASHAVTSVQARFLVPRGLRVVALYSADTSGNFINTPINEDPQETINPSLTPYDYGRSQLITWTLGEIPGTVSANLTSRTRTMQVLMQVQHDVPHTLAGENGVYQTAQITADRYNLSYTPPSGGSLLVYKGMPPAVSLSISAEELVESPVLGVDKTALGSMVFRNTRVNGDDTFRGDLVGVQPGERITYFLNFHNNASSTAASRCTIEDRIPPGLTLHGNFKISRDGDPAHEEELVDRDYRFFDAKGGLVSGDPWFDDGDGVYEAGETYIDADLNGKFTPRRSQTLAKILVFNLGELGAGERGYIRYECNVGFKTGEVFASGAYALRTESLREPIQGSPAVTYAKVIKSPAFEISARPSLTHVAAGEAVSYDNEVTNVSGTMAAGRIVFDIPPGMKLLGTPEQIGPAGEQVGGVELLPRGKPTTMIACETPDIAFGQKVHLKFVLQVLSSAELPSTIIDFPSRVTVERSTVSANIAAEQGTRNHRIADLKSAAESSATVRLVAPDKAELWGMKAMLMSQEARGNLTYLIVAGNGGNIAAKNVQVAFAIPAGTAFVDAGPKPASNKKEGKAGQVVRWNLGDIPAHGATGMFLTVNIAHLDKGKVEDNSCVMTCDNSSPIVPGVTRTTVRERPPEPSFWDIVKNAISALGVNIPGQNNDVLRRDLQLRDDSYFYAVGGADMIWLRKAGIAVMPNGGGQVVVAARKGDANGGTVICTADNTEIRIGTGADVHLYDGAILSESAILNLAAEAQARNDAEAPSLFINGNEKLVQVKSDGARLVNNSDGSLAGAIQPKSGGGLVAAGGGNLVAAGGGNIVAAGGGNLVAAGGGNILSHNGGQLVAAGGGNLVAAGGGNLVAAGGGNMVAAGAGNLVAAGGGNLVAAGGGNLVAAGGGNLVAAGAGNLVAAGGGNLVAAGGGN